MFMKHIEAIKILTAIPIKSLSTPSYRNYKGNINPRITIRTHSFKIISL